MLNTIMFVARDKDGELNMFDSEPKKLSCCYSTGKHFSTPLRLVDVSRTFENLTFDDGPVRCEVTIRPISNEED